MITDLKTFHRYVYTFYGNGGVYTMGATYLHIREATQKHINVCEDFCGDSIDRESVRDIMIEDYNLKIVV